MYHLLGWAPPRLPPLLGRSLGSLRPAPSESALKEEQRFRVSLLCKWGGLWGPALASLQLHPPGLPQMPTKERGVEATQPFPQPPSFPFTLRTVLLRTGGIPCLPGRGFGPGRQGGQLGTLPG